MAEESFGTLDTEVSQEWLLEHLATDQSSINLTERLRNAFLKVSVKNVDKNEVDEVARKHMATINKLYTKGLISKEQYEKEVANGDRERFEIALAEVSEQVVLENGIAAAEFLSALLGFPSSSFKHFLESYEGEEELNLWLENETPDITSLAALVPDALTALRRLSDAESLSIIGLHGEAERASWLRSLDELRLTLQRNQ